MPSYTSRFGPVPPHPQMQQVLDDILDGLHKGTMVIEAIDATWDKNHVQRYELRIVDVGRSSWLARQLQQQHQQHQQQQHQVWQSIPQRTAVTPLKPKPIENLGETTEPLIGYRDFLLGSPQHTYPRPGLMSRNKAPWPMREPMVAFCKKGAFSPHDAPALGCECGIYSFARPDHHDLVDSESVIWGEIAMWGEVLICGQEIPNSELVVEGYRAEFAYPKTLFLRDLGTKSIRWLRDSLVDSYGVPVFLVPERQGKTAGEIMGEMLAELTEGKSK